MVKPKEVHERLVAKKDMIPAQCVLMFDALCQTLIDVCDDFDTVNMIMMLRDMDLADAVDSRFRANTGDSIWDEYYDFLDIFDAINEWIMYYPGNNGSAQSTETSIVKLAEDLRKMQVRERTRISIDGNNGRKRRLIDIKKYELQSARQVGDEDGNRGIRIDPVIGN